MSRVHSNEFKAPSRDSTFAPTIYLLRKRLRIDLLDLYSALRTIDDLVDDGDPLAVDRLEAAERWCRTGEATSPEALIFSRLARHGLGTRPVIGFCRAMRADVERREIESEEELEAYCELASGSIAIMVAQLAGASDPGVHDKLRTLGKAVQLTHILCDIDVDRAAGRTYIPRDVIARFGSIEFENREPLLRHFIDKAVAWYMDGTPAIRSLPEGRRWMAAAAGLYREALQELERDCNGNPSKRVVVSRRRRCRVIARAIVTGR